MASEHIKCAYCGATVAHKNLVPHLQKCRKTPLVVWSEEEAAYVTERLAKGGNDRAVVIVQLEAEPRKPKTFKVEKKKATGAGRGDTNETEGARS